jgi:hypothetical protein
LLLINVISFVGCTDSTETVEKQSSAQAPVSPAITSKNDQDDTKLTDIAFCTEVLVKMKDYWKPGNLRYIQSYKDSYIAKIVPVEEKFSQCLNNDQSRIQLCVDQLSAAELAIVESINAGRNAGNEFAMLYDQSAEKRMQAGAVLDECKIGQLNE